MMFTLVHDTGTLINHLGLCSGCVCVCVWVRASILFEFVCVCFCVVSWQTHFVILLGKRHSASIWKGTMQGRSQSGGEEIPPSVCPLTVSLLSSCLQHNKTRCPLQFIAAFLMRSVGAQNFKACCRVTFFSEAVLCKQRERLLFKTRQLNLFW